VVVDADEGFNNDKDAIFGFCVFVACTPQHRKQQKQPRRNQASSPSCFKMNLLHDRRAA
jgi:hypothetical protein